MYFEHINLVVDDLEEMITFYQAVFPHWKIRDSGLSDWNGKSRRWLHFGDAYQYLALSDNGDSANRDLSGHQIGLAHFAFVVNNIKPVIARLTEAGFTTANNGADNPYRENVYYIDPAGFEVEFVEYSSDIPSQRNSTT